MEIKTLKFEWEELDSVFETIFHNILGKSIMCNADFDAYDFWGVMYVDYQMPLDEIEKVCAYVDANEEERAEAFPTEEDSTGRDIGPSIATKLLSNFLGCTWKKIFADEDALYLLECTDIK